MIFVRFLILGVVLGIGGFIVLGPGRDFLINKLASLIPDGREISFEGDKAVLGSQLQDSEDGKKFNQKAGFSLPIVAEILKPVEQTSLTIQKTIEQIKNLPQDEINTIRGQICNPQ